MAPLGEDFFGEDDFDAILAVIDEDLLEKNRDLTKELSEIVEEIVDDPSESCFSCDICSKTCKTQRGLTRHRNAKHRQPQNQLNDDSLTTAETKLHPLYFKKYTQLSASKLSKDECYSEKTRNEFVNYVISSFKGDAEKFYPAFYKSVSENIVFRNLSNRSSILLGFEVANHVLAHLTNSTVKENTVEFSSHVNFSP
ncbi:uncharacterized protein LOC130614365 [Hydractinia symbiolongicarpus]|uniref:uncharacterized protein LOC130614365 n=1 Tax=Hydractinia symbiolongicarpus TaxID=13093 RepID=UPI00254F83DE|nr:uncharacterized protein LOC130614365 [Hydractinia symbiolongicarpus]